MVYAADKFLRDFLGISSIRNPGILNNRNHEDPTYPIFHIKFSFNPPEAKHPDYVTNRLLSDLENESSPVSPESAIKYLYNVGEPERAEMLKKFNISLKNISEKTPWFFQSIFGIDSLFKHGYETEQRGEKSLQDAIITINTLDSIDYRITALKDLYRKIAYDRKFRRWVLPVNMRRFRMSILVGDYRQMTITEDNYSINPRQALSTLRDIDVFNASNIGGKLLGRVQDGALSFVKRLQWWDNHFSCLVFDCQDCEFDMSSFSDINNLDHKGLKIQQNSFKIKIGRVLETNTYSLLEYSLSDNLIENFLKSENKSEVISRSKNLSGAFKPKVSSWSNYQNLEREKGDNKRVILDDGGFSNALGAGINEAADTLGLGGVLGGGGGIAGSLGSIVDFAGDTASEIAQEALGLATEQIAANVYGNELSRSIAGVGLGILNGDLNQVAQNFSNPALAGALGINVESSGRPVQPNLRDGVPSKLDLTAPSVQRSLSDVQANLTGQGSDPRFQSVGRPGESLFNNPDPSNRLFDQKNIDLQAARVETEMPDNVEFTEVRKETRLNPNKESLTGSTPKNNFDESSVNLQGAGKKTDLVPSNTDLTGAQPLKDLIPSNAELNGAEPLKDLVPSNAELNGAEPMKDLVPNNAELNGAEPIKDLIPGNADLTGAQPLKDLIPSNAELNGAESLKDLVPSNIDLTESEPLKDLVPSNADLTGTNPIRDFNQTNADLTGTQPIRDFNQTNADLTGTNPIRDFNQTNADLTGTQPIRDFNQTNADLTGTQPIRDFNQTNVNLLGVAPSNDMTPKNIELTGISNKTNVSTLGNERLVGKNPQRDFNIKNVNLIGKSPLKTMDDNVNFNTTVTQSTPKLNNVNLQGSDSVKNLQNNNVDLSGREPLNNTTSNIYSGQQSLGLIGNNNNSKQNRIDLRTPSVRKNIGSRNLGSDFDS